MSERERWIVYPLLFLALGSAIRDKMLHAVQTGDLQCDRIVAGTIVCEGLQVVDAAQPHRVVAQLASAEPTGPASERQQRFGALVLIDSQGQELCSVTNNRLNVRGIVCEDVAVVDPAKPNQFLARLSAATVRSPEGQVRRLGSLLLTDGEGREIFGLADDDLRMRNVRCEGVTITDPTQPRRVLAKLASAPLRTNPEGAVQHVGVLALNNQEFVRVLGLPNNLQPPPATAPEEPPAAEATPDAPADATPADAAPADAPSADAADAEPAEIPPVAVPGEPTAALRTPRAAQVRLA
jgi:hypothetical protein